MVANVMQKYGLQHKTLFLYCMRSLYRQMLTAQVWVAARKLIMIIQTDVMRGY